MLGGAFSVVIWYGSTSQDLKSVNRGLGFRVEFSCNFPRFARTCGIAADGQRADAYRFHALIPANAAPSTLTAFPEYPMLMASFSSSSLFCRLSRPPSVRARKSMPAPAEARHAVWRAQWGFLSLIRFSGGLVQPDRLKIPKRIFSELSHCMF